MKLKGVIVDRYNVIPTGSEIGTGCGEGEERYFREPSGLFVLERGRDPLARVSEHAMKNEKRIMREYK